MKSVKQSVTRGVADRRAAIKQVAVVERRVACRRVAVKQVAVERRVAERRVASIDPKEWLMVHAQPELPMTSCDDSVWLSVGDEAIADSDGCVVSALAASPDLRVEIVLAHLLKNSDIGGQARNLILELGHQWSDTNK